MWLANSKSRKKSKICITIGWNQKKLTKVLYNVKIISKSKNTQEKGQIKLDCNEV